MRIKPPVKQPATNQGQEELGEILTVLTFVVALISVALIAILVAVGAEMKTKTVIKCESCGKPLVSIQP